MGGPRVRKVEYDRDGVPIDPRDWTELDWSDLFYGMQAIKLRIAARHHRREKAETEVGDGSLDRARL